MSGNRRQPPAGGPSGQSQYGSSGNSSDFTPWIKLGIGSYLVFALGTAVTMLLFIAFAPDSGGVTMSESTFGSVGGSSDTVFSAFAFGLVLLLFLAGGIATGLGLFIGRDADRSESAPLVSAVSNAVGATVASFVVLICLAIFEPSSPRGGVDGGSLVGDLVLPMFGVAIGVAITGAAAATLSRKSASW